MSPIGETCELLGEAVCGSRLAHALARGYGGRRSSVVVCETYLAQ
jgi:hypothetical protein